MTKQYRLEISLMEICGHKFKYIEHKSKAIMRKEVASRLFKSACSIGMIIDQQKGEQHEPSDQ